MLASVWLSVLTYKHAKRGATERESKMQQWLEKELETANEAHQDAVRDSGYASPRARYWNGYLDALTNTQNELSGMSEE